MWIIKCANGNMTANCQLHTNYFLYSSLHFCSNRCIIIKVFELNRKFQERRFIVCIAKY